MRRRTESSARRRRSGQAILEYVLLMTALAVVSIGFAKFMNEMLFGQGLENLPKKVGNCISHQTVAKVRDNPCQ